MKKWKELLDSGKAILKKAGLDNSEFEATQLLLKFYKGTYSSYLLNCESFASFEAEEQYLNALNCRLNKIPLQYILGEWDFYESTFFIGPGVLIPRPETEELVDICVKLIKNNHYRTIYDLCAGSGCIGLSIAKKFPDIKCYLFELYDIPISYIFRNAANLKLNNVEIVKCDILKGSVPDIPCADLIISNPPYIKSDDVACLQEEVLKEPHTALDGGTDGLLFYRAIAEHWFGKLSQNASVAIECGEEQSNEICSLFNCFEETQTVYDSYGVDRFVIGKNFLKGANLC